MQDGLPVVPLGIPQPFFMHERLGPKIISAGGGEGYAKANIRFNPFVWQKQGTRIISIDCFLNQTLPQLLHELAAKPRSPQIRHVLVLLATCGHSQRNLVALQKVCVGEDGERTYRMGVGHDHKRARVRDLLYGHVMF